MVVLAVNAAALSLIYVGAIAPTWGLLGVVLLGALAGWAIRTHVAGIACVFAVVSLLGTVAAAPRLAMVPPADRHLGSAAEDWRQQEGFDERLPVVIHVILDEMTSAGAIPDDVPAGPAVRAALRNFGRAEGFRVFDSVYSRFFFSGISIPNMMTEEFAGRDNAHDLVTGIRAAVSPNAYFDAMARRGYRTAVFQSAILDFCRSASVSLCQTFPSHDPTAAEDDLDTRQARVWESVLHAYEPSLVATASQQMVRWFYGLGERPLSVLGVADRYDVNGFSAWFDQLLAFVRDVPRGTHVFAHLMVPHSPYLLTNRCVVGGAFDSGYYLTRFEDESVRAVKRREYYGQYLEQVQCVFSRMDELLGVIRTSPALSDAIVIVHGDHGSRISNGELLDQMTPRDYVDNYGTFFAVRGPGFEPGIDCELRSLPQLFRQVVQDGRAGPAETEPVLVKERAGGEDFQERPMVPFGCATASVDTE